MIFRKALAKTRNFLKNNFSFNKLNEVELEEIEEILYLADIKENIVEEIIQKLKESKNKEAKDFLIKEILKNKLIEKQIDEKSFYKDTIILVLGVNGSGKTSFCAKLADRIKNNNLTVSLAAADTFRAAAIDQLKILGDKINIKVIAGKENSDPGAIIYDAIAHQKSKGIDCLIIDTAGRLHTNQNLIKQLEKIKNIIQKTKENLNLINLLVIDATVGTNGLSQAKLFSEAIDIDAIVVNKLDGSAKAGSIISISDEMKIPVLYCGIGEKIEDINLFNKIEFIDNIFS